MTYILFIIAFESILRFCVFILDGIDICVNKMHPEKAQSLIDLIEEGMSNDIFVIDEHSENAAHPIDSIEDGIVICVNDEHLLKAKFPIEVTEEGISNDISVNDEHSSKA